MNTSNLDKTPRLTDCLTDLAGFDNNGNNSSAISTSSVSSYGSATSIASSAATNNSPGSSAVISKRNSPDDKNFLNSSMAATMSQELYDKFGNDQVLTHGYVHGHIHKHKDHTHIHGHIHNHDHHDHHHDHDESKRNNDNVDSNCHEFDEMNICKDIFCDELDDCYFFNCDDTKKDPVLVDINESTCTDCTETCNLKCEGHSEAKEDGSKVKHSDENHKDDCCYDPNCLNYSYCCDQNAICNDPSCLQSSENKIINSNSSNQYDCCFPNNNELLHDNCNGSFEFNNTHHQNNLCDFQLNKKPIFENLIENVYKNVDHLNDVEQTRKRKLDAIQNQRDVKNFELHFPHPCHPIPPDATSEQIANISNDSINSTDANDSMILPSNHHHLHQSCFHTKIPNLEKSLDDKALSDFDFYIQFNNFNKFLNDQQTYKKQKSLHTNQNDILPEMKKHIPDVDNSMLFLDNTSLPTNPIMTQKPNSTNPFVPELLSQSKDSPTFSCQWDNCFRKVTDSTLMLHLITEHIDQEYDLKSNSDKNQSYQCEWNECNFMNDDLNTLITHLNCHRGKHDIDNSLFNTTSAPTLITSHSPALTPNSISKSSITSPRDSLLNYNIDDSLLFKNSKPKIKEEHNVDDIKSIEEHEDTSQNQLNITSMKISPKPKGCKLSCCHPIDSDFTCKWQLGVDADGKPICCNKKHASSGDLQHHLVTDHIGLGKSIYHCAWIGCERNNGKSFTQRQKLMRHIHIHTHYKPCKCEICGACFAVDSMLKQHLRIHSGEKPFSCSICGKKFATSSSLSIHNRVHTGEKPLVCKWPNCGKRFSESSNLTKHMRIHFKSFKCEVCGEEFEKKTQFTKHMRSHEHKQDPPSINKVPEALLPV